VTHSPEAKLLEFSCGERKKSPGPRHVSTRANSRRLQEGRKPPVLPSAVQVTLNVLHAKLLGPVAHLVVLVNVDSFVVVPTGFLQIIGHEDFLSVDCAISGMVSGPSGEAASECQCVILGGH
jgi:hypothetical protein